ncbi:taste receptor type 2 member 1-like [Bombina bombina]|uniref:taste receptor type 2 member 1-like n=1 Tax=Bombina bombina TaxID=8345 RepID=UPI00235ABF4E|nr:taste receptor type 2 member 1-like [Bombina bombina]XP_053552357.1 taste receptor type 2 member 1-like [Bombina bombina]XP_053552358.1 taste receptor type 2 member 1-like [Bombina bombina]
MASVNMLALSAVQMITCLLGLATNGFILLVSIWAKIQHRLPASSDYFICSLAMSNLFLQVSSAGNWMCELFQESHPFCNIIYVLKMISSSCNLVLSSWLCVFYCSRIVVFHHCTLIWLQRTIKSSYKYFIFFSVFLCVLMGIPLMWTRKEDGFTIQSFNSSIPGNKTIKYTYMNLYRTFLVLFVYCIPLLCVLLSAGLILRSLSKHMRRLHITMRAGHEVRMEAHLQAGYTVLSLLILFIGYFVNSIIILIDVFPEGDTRLFICYLASFVYCLAHGMVLIRGNVKLRKVAAGILMKYAQRTMGNTRE